jgi:heme-degrading monooxygenase HmoA
MLVSIDNVLVLVNANSGLLEDSLEECMFIVMNRFQVNRGRDTDFEAGWQDRERHLSEFDGFVSFSLLKNWLAGEATTEYISHTIWASRENFETWRNSEQFGQAHAAGSMAGVLAGPPQAALYEAVLEEHNPRPVRAV